MHVPSTMEQAIALDVMGLVFAVNPSILTGGSATTNIEGSDRDRTVTVGNSVGSIQFDVSLRLITAPGTVEFIVFRAERFSVTPAVGTDPIPSSADVTSQGSQQAWRMAMPGRILHFSQISVTPETVRAVKIRVNPAKFRMAKVRPGDFIGIAIFNRSSGTLTFSVQMRYKEFT